MPWILFLPFLIRAVTAAVAAAVAAPQVIGCGEYHQAALQVKVPWLHSQRHAGGRCRRRALVGSHSLLGWLGRLGWLNLGASHLRSNPIRVASRSPACLKSAPR